MLGTMMNFPLTLTHVMHRAQSLFKTREIVTRRHDKTVLRSSYAEVTARARRLASALVKLGVKPGDRVASLAWNHQRHLELYMGVPYSGAVLHTLNLRLHPTEIGYIANHAGDKVVVVDESLLPLFEKVREHITTLEHVVVIRETDMAPATNFIDYEWLIGTGDADFEAPPIDENAAAMICYTSGTTGNPKGVVYSHRSMVLHSFAACLADALGVAGRDTLLPVVPMFHANAWGLPIAAMMTGAKIVFPGPHLDAASIVDLMAREHVTIAAGVPTIWLGILQLLDKDPKRFDLSRMRTMVIGGSAAPPSMIEGFKKRHNLEVTHAWGMTETNPLGTIANVKASLADGNWDSELHIRSSQGYPVPFVEIRHVSENGLTITWDGTTMGELEVRGPWVAQSYLGGEGADKFTPDGWFRTGDVVTIDGEGYVRITDRAKDVVKSGGEWISSVALENALMSHPAVLEAAVFAARHEKWDERPLAAVVIKEGHAVTKEELRAHLEGKFAKFWMPDDYLFIAQIPRTSTGKFLKTKLREEYGEYLIGKS
jgi:fatty-acyl-CoA synthase